MLVQWFRCDTWNSCLIHGHDDSTLDKDAGTLQLNVEKESECLPSSTIALDNIDIGRELEIEGDMPVETSFTKDNKVDEKKKYKEKKNSNINHNF